MTKPIYDYITPDVLDEMRNAVARPSPRRYLLITALRGTDYSLVYPSMGKIHSWRIRLSPSAVRTQLQDYGVPCRLDPRL